MVRELRPRLRAVATSRYSTRPSHHCHRAQIRGRASRSLIGRHMADPHIVDRVQESAARLKRPVEVSFEFFPPNDAQMAETLWASVQRLAPLNPRFVSVTYGADGSTRQRTHHLVHRIQSETTLTGAPHLTCIGTTREELIEIARS